MMKFFESAHDRERGYYVRMIHHLNAECSDEEFVQGCERLSDRIQELDNIFSKAPRNHSRTIAALRMIEDANEYVMNLQFRREPEYYEHAVRSISHLEAAGSYFKRDKKIPALDDHDVINLALKLWGRNVEKYMFVKPEQSKGWSPPSAD